MGGAFDEVRGKSIIESYLRYKDLVEDFTAGSWEPDPTFKKYCKSCMIFDEAAQEWVLYYHFHT